MLGTLNNCGGGMTPWGTVLTGEENFNQYFGNADQVTDPVIKARLARYGLRGLDSARKWERFDVAKEPNETNRHGWIMELGVVQSRRENNLAARFPEIVAAGRQVGDVVLDGELVALLEGRLDFGALASPPRRRAEAGVTIYYIAFDLLAEGDRDWRPEPMRGRRARLEELFAEVAAPLQLIPQATEQDDALVWMERSNALVGG